jgi:hypothetical protein
MRGVGKLAARQPASMERLLQVCVRSVCSPYRHSHTYTHSLSCLLVVVVVVTSVMAASGGILTCFKIDEPGRNDWPGGERVDARRQKVAPRRAVDRVGLF